MDFRRYTHANTERVFRHLGIWDGPVAKTRQKHTRSVIFCPGRGEYVGIDGFAQMDLCSMIVTADCIPLFLRSQDGSFQALLHAGWQGVWKRIHIEALRRAKVRPEALSAWLLPSIGALHYEVREDFLSKFSGRRHAKSCTEISPGKTTFDLRRLLAFELRDAGIPAGRIHLEDHSTFDSPFFHSYRREGVNYGLNAIVYVPRQPSRV